MGQVSSEISIPAWDQFDESQQVILDDPQFWSSDHPHLYQVISTIRVDGEIRVTCITQIGIRSIRFDAEQGFFLNEQPVPTRRAVRKAWIWRNWCVSEMWSMP